MSAALKKGGSDHDVGGGDEHGGAVWARTPQEQSPISKTGGGGGGSGVLKRGYSSPKNIEKWGDLAKKGGVDRPPRPPYSDGPGNMVNPDLNIVYLQIVQIG